MAGATEEGNGPLYLRVTHLHFNSHVGAGGRHIGEVAMLREGPNFARTVSAKGATRMQPPGRCATRICYLDPSFPSTDPALRGTSSFVCSAQRSSLVSVLRKRDCREAEPRIWWPGLEVENLKSDQSLQRSATRPARLGSRSFSQRRWGSRATVDCHRHVTALSPLITSGTLWG